MGPDERQEWLRENVISPSEYGWGLNREGYDRCPGQTCIERITAGGSQSASSSPSPRSEVGSSCLLLCILYVKVCVNEYAAVLIAILVGCSLGSLDSSLNLALKETDVN